MHDELEVDLCGFDVFTSVVLPLTEHCTFLPVILNLSIKNTVSVVVSPWHRI